MNPQDIRSERPSLHSDSIESFGVSSESFFRWLSRCSDAVFCLDREGKLVFKNLSFDRCLSELEVDGTVVCALVFERLGKPNLDETAAVTVTVQSAGGEMSMQLKAEPMDHGWVFWVKHSEANDRKWDLDALSLIAQSEDVRGIVKDVFTLLKTEGLVDVFGFDLYGACWHEASEGFSEEEWSAMVRSPNFEEAFQGFKSFEHPSEFSVEGFEVDGFSGTWSFLTYYPIMIDGELVGTVLLGKRGDEIHHASTMEKLHFVERHLLLAIKRLELIRRLRFSERVFRAIGEELTYGAWISPASQNEVGFGNSEYISQSFLNVIGGEPDSHGQIDWSKIIHPDDFGKIQQSWYLAHGEKPSLWECESRMKSKNGEWIHVLSRGVPIFSEDGRLSHWAGINVDVSQYRNDQYKIEKKTRSLGVLNDMAAKLSASMEVDDILQVVANSVVEISSAEFGTVFYRKFSEQDKNQVFFAHAGYSISQFGEFIPPEYPQLFNDEFKNQGLVTRSIASCDPKLEIPAPFLQTISKDLKSYLSIPLVTSTGELVGGVFLGHSEERHFDEDCATLIFNIMGQSSVVVEKALLYQQLQKTAEQLSLAVSIANIGEVYWDSETDLMEMSPRAREIFNLHPYSQHSRQDLRARIVPSDQERANIGLENAIRDHTDYDVEYRIARQDGRRFWLATRGRGIYNDQGKLLGMAGVIQDITPQKNVEMELRDARIRLEATLHAAEIGTWTWDIREGSFVFDQNASRMFSHTPALLAGLRLTSLLDVVHPDDKASVENALQQIILESQNEFEIDFRIETDSGEVRWFNARGKLTRDGEGRPKLLPGVVMDITSRRQVEMELKQAKEAAEAANLAKDRFLAVLSHELRTPLTPVLLLVEELEYEQSLSAEIRENVALIKRNVELEARLIDDLLDLSKIVSGKLNLSFENVDLHGILEQVLHICRPQIEEKHIKISLQVPNDPVVIEADTSRIHQIFWNIIKNAVKFSGPHSEVRVVMEKLDDDMVMLQVIDQGIGIDPVALSRIFSAFEQEDADTSQRFGGLGLGLAITKALVRLHNGQITANSQGKNHGSTFEIILPLKKGVETLRNKGVMYYEKTSRSLRILLVEDHVDTATILSKLLRRAGHQITLARNVAEAERLLCAGDFQLIISDIGLPDASGFDLMKKVTELKGIPGIAISGYGMPEDLRKSKEAGFGAHFVKPILIQELESTIESLVALRS